jgi:hypothetical protein
MYKSTVAKIERPRNEVDVRDLIVHVIAQLARCPLHWEQLESFATMGEATG